MIMKKLVFNTMAKSLFSYCPLVWMFHSRTSSNGINKVHGLELTVVLNVHTSDFKTLLQKKKNNDVCNHHRNIQNLLTEIFRTKNGLAPPIM